MHSHTQLEFIVEAVPALIGYVDVDERYRFNNLVYQDWFGRPVEEFVGRTVRDVIGDVAYATVAPHVRAALAGRLVTFESELTYRDGKPRYVRATYVPDVGEDGRVRGFVAHVTDITDLKQAEAERERLRRHADELARVSRRLTESLDIGEVAERIAECILPLFQAQSSVVRLLLPDGSLACVAIAGKWLENFKPGYLLPPGVGLVGRAVIERRALWTRDILDEPSVVLTPEFRRGLAGAGHHAVLAVPLQVKGEIIGAVSTAHAEIRTFSQAEIDLLQAFADQAALAMRNVQLFAREQTARAEAEAANHAKDQFLALLAHELRNPLAPIVTSAALLRRPGTPGDRRRALGRHRGAAGAQPRPPPRRSPRRLAHHPRPDRAALDRALDRRRRRARAGGYASARRRAAARRVGDPAAEAAVRRGRPGAARTDHRQRVEQRRQVHTARRAHQRGRRPGGRRGRPAGERHGDRDPGGHAFAHLRAVRPGRSIARAHVRRTGYRPDAGPPSREAPPRSRRGAQRRAGAREPVHGRAAAQPPGVRADRSRVRPRTCPPADVLLIEDNDDARQSLRALLEYEGHRVAETADGTTGLDRDETMRPDIVLIDIGLPGLDGYEVARRIRARRGTDPILVAITGYGQVDDQRRSLEAGFDAHLTKPVSPDQLTGLLGTLAHSRARP